MSIKLMGALLVFLGCGGFGMSMAGAFRREEWTLGQLLRALEYMSCELSYRLTPLPQLCRNTSASVTGDISQIFLCLADELDQQIAPDAASCMQVVLAKWDRMPRSVHRLLSELGQTLGQFDLPGQVRGIEGCIQTTRSTLHQHGQDKCTHIRSYQTLGLCAGAALAILLL